MKKRAPAPIHKRVPRTNAELRHQLDELRDKTEERFQIVFEVLDKLLAGQESQRIIGFVDSEK